MALTIWLLRANSTWGLPPGAPAVTAGFALALLILGAPAYLSNDGELLRTSRLFRRQSLVAVDCAFGIRCVRRKSVSQLGTVSVVRYFVFVTDGLTRVNVADCSDPDEARRTMELLTLALYGVRARTGSWLAQSVVSEVQGTWMEDADAAQRYLEQSGMRGRDLAFGLGKSLRGKKTRTVWLLALSVLVVIAVALAILFGGFWQSVGR